MTSSGVAMRFEQELHHGLRVIIEIEQQPGTHNALTVSADVSLSGQFLTQRLEQYQGGNRIFASRLVEGIDLLEEDEAPEGSQLQSQRQAETTIAGVGAAFVSAPAATPTDTSTGNRGGLGHYRCKEDIPAPPSDKPWLKHGGLYGFADDRYFRVSARLVKRRLGSEKFYMLAFVAHKQGRTKTFAATLCTESEREQAALAWLRSDTNVEREGSEEGSTAVNVMD